jgi:hypothetical protein
MNIAFLVKWFWKMENNEGLWQTVFFDKYIPDGFISRVKKKQGDSQFWSSLLKVKDIFLQIY